MLSPLIIILYMKLLSMDLDTFSLSFDPEMLAIKPFNKIIQRDKSKGKIVAIAELSYMWFFINSKSDFLQIIDEDERSETIIEAIVGLPKGWKPDAVVLDAMDFYKKHSLTVTSRMLEDAMSIIDNMSKWAKVAALHLDEMIGDKPKYDISKIQAFIRDVPKMVATIKTLEDEVLKEKDTTDSHRGSQEKAMMEDGE